MSLNQVIVTRNLRETRTHVDNFSTSHPKSKGISTNHQTSKAFTFPQNQLGNQKCYIVRIKELIGNI